MRHSRSLFAALIVSTVSAGCGGGGTSPDASALDAASDAGALDAALDAGTLDAASDAGPIASGVVHVVLFTHIEDQTPGGMLGTAMSRTSYLATRRAMIAMAERARTHALQWVLQPDWKILEAARIYEDAATTADTGGKNLFRYLRDELGVVIDPHSHESRGYNYTDVAFLLEDLGVGGSTVIGGHVWDPLLREFSEWDRFRTPLAGSTYPDARWRGDILIGAGTPLHVNDPVVSGVWRPQDRDNFFVDDPGGNIVVVGAWHDDVPGVQALVDLYASGAVPPSVMLTASWNVNPASIMGAAGLDAVEASVLVPIAALRDEGSVVVTDFTSLVATWRSSYGGEAYLYEP